MARSEAVLVGFTVSSYVRFMFEARVAGPFLLTDRIFIMRVCFWTIIACLAPHGLAAQGAAEPNRDDVTAHWRAITAIDLRGGIPPDPRQPSGRRAGGSRYR